MLRSFITQFFRIWPLLFAVAALMSPWPMVRAEETNSDPAQTTDAGVLAGILADRHPRVRGRISEAQARYKAARALSLSYPDPMLELSRSQSGMRELELADPSGMGGRSRGSEVRVNQPIPFPGKITTQARVAEIEYNVARIAVAMERNKFAAELLRSLDSAATARRLADLTKDYATRLAIISEIARSRYSAGKGPIADVSRAEVRITVARQRLVALEGDFQARTRELSYFLKNGNSAAVSMDQLQPVVLDWKYYNRLVAPIAERVTLRESQIAENSLEIRMAYEEELRRDRMRTAAQLDYLPDFEVFAGRGVRSSEFRYGTNKTNETMTTFGLNIRIPLWSVFGTSQKVDSESASLRAARSTIANGEAKVQADLEALRERHKSKADAIRLFIQDTIPRAIQARDSAMIAYQAGAIDFTSLSDSWESLYMQEFEKIRSEEEHVMHVIDMGEILNAILPKNAVPPKGSSFPNDQGSSGDEQGAQK